MNTLRAMLGAVGQFFTGLFWATGLGAFLGFALYMQIGN